MRTPAILNIMKPRTHSSPPEFGYSEDLEMSVIDTKIGVVPLILTDEQMETTKTENSRESDDHYDYLMFVTKTASQRESDDASF